MSVSWGDHLVFGEGDGKLDTPELLDSAINRWKENLDAGTILWRENRSRQDDYVFAAEGYEYAAKVHKNLPDFDDFEISVSLSHNHGLKNYLYVTLNDHGWPLPEEKIRKISYHNEWHAKDISFQTRFSHDNPNYVLEDRMGNKQWGVLCLAYPEVRQYLQNQYIQLLQDYNFDGLFICTRSQSKPSDFADQFGFNEPIVEEFKSKFGKNILEDDFDLQLWRDLQGEYLTIFLSELNKKLVEIDHSLGIGCSRGEVLGPPLSNVTLNWRKWVDENLIDFLAIDQSSSKCPSLWIDLWPMHRGYGYIQNYNDSFNMNSLSEDLNQVYSEKFPNNQSKLYVSRQWTNTTPKDQKSILNHTSVSGMVFSSYRYENQSAIQKSNWEI